MTSHHSPASDDIHNRVSGLETRVDDHERAIERLDHKDNEIGAALNRLSEALNRFVSDSAEGRVVLERMLTGIILHRGWLAVVAIASSAPAWIPYVRPLVAKLWGSL